MTTWTTVTPTTAAYSDVATLPNGYVLVGYVVDGYIDASSVWATVSPVSTTWTTAP